jgi:hypothetical protein
MNSSGRLLSYTLVIEAHGAMFIEINTHPGNFVELGEVMIKVKDLM